MAGPASIQVRRVSERLLPLLRGVAGFLGVFTLLNLAGEFWVPGFDGTIWWLDLRQLPSGVSTALIWSAGLLMSWWCAVPGAGVTRGRSTALVLLALAAMALWNGACALKLQAEGAVVLGLGAPLSLLVFAVLVALSVSTLADLRPLTGARSGKCMAVLFGLGCAGFFPLLLMGFYGGTEYRRPADAIVVFGARVYKSGVPSDALRDRMSTATELWAEGRAQWMVVSGGPGDGAVDEADAMRQFAVRAGVPESRVLSDHEGSSTQDTVRNTARMATERGFKTLIAVSHGYHLPRVKLAYERAGVRAFTVPAAEARQLILKPYFVAREVAAFWYYYLEPLLTRETPRSASYEHET